MSDSKPVAATVQEIKAAFPKAKAEFVLTCIEKSLPMASVASAAAEEMMKENEELVAKVAAMEEELAKARAEMEESAKSKAMEGECEEEVAKAKAEEEEKEVAKARRTGVKPVAQATSGKPSASARWDNAIDVCMTKTGNNKAKAVAMANRQNPGLREAYLAEVNAR